MSTGDVQELLVIQPLLLPCSFRQLRSGVFGFTVALVFYLLIAKLGYCFLFVLLAFLFCSLKKKKVK
jgi:hypothetical protein